MADIKPANLRCEWLVNPLGVDAARPRLSWMLESDQRNQTQSAYQILAASDEKALRANRGDLWDSGKVGSDESLHIEYSGPALKSGQRCFWKVRAWDQDGKVSAYSKPASWEMGLLNSSDWRGKWIARTTEKAYTPAPMLRKEFRLSGRVKGARAYICGLGYYDLRINGKRVGDQVLDPGYTRYDRRALYATHDVTKLLKSGENAVGVTLGTGWYNFHPLAVWYFDRAPWRNSPRLLMDLRVEYVDGRSEVIASDPSWKTSTGPIIYDSVYSGETYDARLEKPGWDTAAYDDRDWQAVLVVDGPGGKLSSQQMPPIRVSKTLKPTRILEPQPGVYVVDFGENISGWARMKVSGPAGTEVRLKYGEKIKPDGSLDLSNIYVHMIKTNPPQRFQEDRYVLKGRGTETWEPSFEYNGFQYVEVTGFPGKPTLENFEAKFCHTDVEPVGEFSCSNDLLNKIWDAGRRAYLSNLQSIPTDCPHREKNGWTGDAHLAAEQGLFNYDALTVYRKWINDLDDEQKPTGELPGIVPTSGWGYEWGNGPAWDSAFLLIPWYAYICTGDKRILTDHYEGFKRYVDYLTTKADKGIVSIGLGDWVPWKTETPVAVTSTGYYYQDALITADTAELLGKRDEAHKYRALAEGIKKGFNDRFVNPETGMVANGSQTALSCAIYMSLISEEVKPKTLALLVEAIRKNNGHIDTGILGSKYVPNALTQMRRSDLAYEMAAKETQPGWGWWIKQGATTLWEQWNGNDSRNHIMFGDIAAWFFKNLAGISPERALPAYKMIVVKPHFAEGLAWARGVHQSPRGKVRSEWKRTGSTIRLEVENPANTRARVYVPVEAGSRVSVQTGGPFRELGSIYEHSVFELGSGIHVFTTERGAGHLRAGVTEVR